jgi:hypothetical protein
MTDDTEWKGWASFSEWWDDLAPDRQDRRPPDLRDNHPDLEPCEECDNTGWCWDPGVFGKKQGEWRFCKECKWRR